jgi:hypothetical protein
MLDLPATERLARLARLLRGTLLRRMRRFHCTNGHECIFDAGGAELRVPASLTSRAEQVARDVMRTLDDRADWSEWRVAVCDLKGRRVLLQPFVSAGEESSALAA